MSCTTVSLYLRPKAGNRQYLKPAIQRNRIRPGWAMIAGNPAQVGGDYYLRFVQDGKRIFQRIGPDLSEALQAQTRTEKMLEAEDQGIKIVKPQNATKGDTLGERVAEYIKYLEVSGRAQNTIEDRVNILDDLVQYLGPDKQMAEITAENLLTWAHEMRNRVRQVDGKAIRLLADATIWYRLRKVRTFLLKYKRDVLKRKEFPRYSETRPDTYTPEELQAFFAACDDEERFRFSLLFGTGMRRGELSHLQWPQVDLRSGLITIQSAEDWQTKTRRCRQVPIPAHLIDELRQRRQAHSTHIYVLGHTRTNLLDSLKRIAFKAGLNCGQCTTKTGHSCADQPVCHKFTVQKLRRSYITHLHEGGTSINTLRTLLGHTSAAPVMRYLAHPDVQSPVLIANLNATFGRVTIPATDVAPPA